MKNNIRSVTCLTHTFNRNSFSVFAMLLALVGCEGGIVGTGDGPKDTTIYQLEYLPDRISPDIPKHLEVAPQEQTNDLLEQSTSYNSTTSLRDSLALTVRAESWQELNLELSLLAIIRLEVQHSITLTDLAIDDIVNRCEQSTECVIPAGDIRVQYTQPVINRLIKLYTDTLGPLQIDQQSQSDYLQDSIGRLSVLRGSEVVFGEITFSKRGGDPYDYQLNTRLTQLDVDREFTVQWRDDKSVTELTTRLFVDEEESIVLSHFYQAGSPGESVIAKLETTAEGRTSSLNIKVISNGPRNSGILLESHAELLGGGSSSSTSDSAASNTGSVGISTGQGESSVNESTDTGTSEVEIVESTTVDQNSNSFKTIRTVQGQIDNQGGYVTVEEYDIPDDSYDSIDYVRLFRETFDADGFLLAGEICKEYSATNRCDSDTAFTMYGPGNASVVDSELYYASGDFEVLESVQDAIRWKVVDVPTDVHEFAVISADTGTVLTERVFLCVGYQVAVGNIQLFCGATDEQLNGGTEIINLTPGEAISQLPTARLIQVN